MTSLRVGFLGMVVVVAVAACARSQRVTPSVSGEGGAGEEAGAAGTGGSAGRSSSSTGGAGGTGGKSGSGGEMTDAGEAGTSRGGDSSSGGASAGRGGSSEGGASGEAGGGVGGVDSVLEINDAQWAAFCQMLFDCPLIESDEIPGFRALLGDEARCRQIFQGSVTGRGGVSDLAEAVEQGRVILQLDQVAACLEASSSCDSWSNRQAVSASCRRVYLGTRAAGEACFRDEECAVGRCVVDDACPGTCQPLGAPGEACATDADCDGSTGQASCPIDTCYVATLLPPVGEGEECWKSSEGEERQPCATGLWCEGDGIYTAPPGSSPGYEYRRGICRGTSIPGGEPCNNDEDVCELGYGCQGEDSSCEAIQIANEVGAPCGEDVGFCDIFERLECVSGFCERTTDGLEGSSCQYLEFLGYRPCEAGLVCVATGMDDPITAETPQTCLVPRAAGESCRRDHECASETCGTDNRCTDRFCETARQWF